MTRRNRSTPTQADLAALERAADRVDTDADLRDLIKGFPFASEVWTGATVTARVAVGSARDSAAMLRATLRSPRAGAQEYVKIVERRAGVRRRNVSLRHPMVGYYRNRRRHTPEWAQKMIKHPGKLTSHGYHLDISKRKRHRALAAVLREWGYESTMQSLVWLVNFGATTEAQHRAAVSDKNWLKRTYGSDDYGYGYPPRRRRKKNARRKSTRRRNTSGVRPPRGIRRKRSLDDQTYYMLWQRVGSSYVMERSFLGHYIKSTYWDDIKQSWSTSRPWVVLPMGVDPNERR